MTHDLLESVPWLRGVEKQGKWGGDWSGKVWGDPPSQLLAEILEGISAPFFHSHFPILIPFLSCWKRLDKGSRCGAVGKALASNTMSQCHEQISVSLC